MTNKEIANHFIPLLLKGKGNRETLDREIDRLMDEEPVLLKAMITTLSQRRGDVKIVISEIVHKDYKLRITKADVDGISIDMLKDENVRFYLSLGFANCIIKNSRDYCFFF